MQTTQGLKMRVKMFSGKIDAEAPLWAEADL